MLRLYFRSSRIVSYSIVRIPFSSGTRTSRLQCYLSTNSEKPPPLRKRPEANTQVVFSDEWNVAGHRRGKPRQRDDCGSSTIDDGVVLFSDELQVSLRTRTKNKGLLSASATTSPRISQYSGSKVKRMVPDLGDTSSPKQTSCSRDSLVRDEVLLQRLQTELNRIKQQLFKITDEFREYQLETMISACLGRNVLCVVPTGSGKSLMYQLPALVRESAAPNHRGVTVVVTPLKALMNDQVRQLVDLLTDAKVGFLHGDMDVHAQVHTLQRLTSLDFLFVTPETLMSRRALAFLRQEPPRRFVFDEAHCIVEWGRSFRPMYQTACLTIKEEFPTVPWTLLTATAPPDVRENLLKLFSAEASQVDIYVTQKVDRENLQYRILTKPSTMKEAVDLISEKLKARPASIVYCLTKDECDAVAAGLQERLGYRIPSYHSGLTSTARTALLTNWQLGLSPIMVATSAFGMGIHHASVRLIIHYSMPISLLSYIQQCGRAGRDGKSAECVLLFDSKAIKVAYQLASEGEAKDDVDEMISFCRSRKCVRQLLQAKLCGTDAARSLSPCRTDCQCREQS